MVLQDIQYYSLNRLYGLLTGLWPGNPGIVTFVQKILITTSFISGIFIQLTVFVTHEFNYILYFRIISCIMPPLVFLLKYLSVVVNNKEFVLVLEWIEDDWNNFTSEEEQSIMERRAKTGRFITKLCTIIFATSVILFVLCPYLPPILDIVIPLNKSRPCRLPVHLEYFIDPDKYFHLILLHIDFTALLGALVLMATEVTSIVVAEHACGLFELVSHHVKLAVEDTILHFKEHMLIRDRVKTVVEIHYRALSFVNFLNNYFSTHYLMLLVLGVASLSLNFYICSQAILRTRNSDEVLISSVLIILHLSYMFCCSYMGQIILDQGDQLLVTAYDTEWYLAPPPIQKLILMFMQRCSKSCPLIAGTLIAASFEIFSVIVRSSMSYFMVLWSIN